ncbi:MAG: hypothetical protein GY822_04650 [Deltaproteobacteria bacterium]|nr:hypothetical protein [Deltaproteobacteria bacterium]
MFASFLLRARHRSPLASSLWTRAWQRRRFRFFGLALCALMLLSTSLLAKPSVFLNGVNIDGVTQQKFKNVTVEIDAQGNVLIFAKGYEVKSVAKNATGGPVTRRYFLISETNAPGMTQFDIDVFINSVWVKRISHKDAQNVIEITDKMHKGKNIVHFTATKSMKNGSLRSPQHYIKVLVGEGNMGGNNVMVDKTLAEYSRTAANTGNHSQEFVVQGR